MNLRERVALLLFHQSLPATTAEDVGHLQRTNAVVPVEILAAAGDLLEQHGLITNRFDDGGFVRRARALDQLLQALQKYEPRAAALGFHQRLKGLRETHALPLSR